MLDEIDRAIGEYDSDNEKRDKRINRYMDIIGDDLVNDYDKNSWFKAAVRRKRMDSGPDEGFGTAAGWGYFWKENYRKSDWYRFQQAVKAHQRKAKEILRPLLEQMEVANLDNW